MKKLFTLTLLLFFIGLSAEAQIFTIGPKLGISNTTLSLKENAEKYQSGESKYSYHGGVFARIKITGFYIQPEAYFNSVNGEYTDATDPNDIKTLEFNQNKIDMPILFGWKMGPLRINAGPVASFNLDDEVDTSSTNSAVSECKTHTTGGYSDWRLPNINELFTIFNDKDGLDKAFKDKSDYKLFSSTTTEDTDGVFGSTKMYIMDQKSGLNSLIDPDSSIRYRCVREISNEDSKD